MAPLSGGPPSDAEILVACQARDRRAAAALVRLHQAQLLRVAMRLVGRASIAEEIVQETFLRAFRDVDAIDPARGARAWLLRTAVNLTRDHLKRSDRAETSAPVDVASPSLHGPAPQNPEEQTSSSQVRRRLDDALAQLPEPLREVVLLHYVEGISFAELKDVLGVRAPVLRMRALRARGRLRSLLKDLVR